MSSFFSIQGIAQDSTKTERHIATLRQPCGMDEIVYGI